MISGTDDHKGFRHEGLFGSQKLENQLRQVPVEKGGLPDGAVDNALSSMDDTVTLLLPRPLLGQTVQMSAYAHSKYG